MRVQSNGKIRRTEAEWEDIFKRYRDSGLSDGDFCRKEKLSKNTFSKWKRAFAEAGPAAQRFVELAPLPLAPAVNAAASRFELSLPGGVVLRWEA